MDDLLYLSQTDVAAVGLSMTDIVDAVEAVFLEKGHGRVEMPPKPGIHTRPDAFIHAMPAHVPALGSAGMKWVAGYPENHGRGLPYISGLLILNDPDTGLPWMVCDCTWITAMRTGAASAVAARYLARADSEVMAILGCGVQGRSNLEALRVVFPGLKRVRAYDIDRCVLIRYAEWAEATFEDLIVDRCEGPEQAVREADIVITAGPILREPRPVIEDEWFAPGSFACPLDFDSYWTPAALRGCDRLCSDDIDQLFFYKEHGYFGAVDKVDADLGDIVAGKAPGRTSDGERIIAMNLGIALEDMAVAIRLYESAREAGIGTRLPL